MLVSMVNSVFLNKIPKIPRLTWTEKPENPTFQKISTKLSKGILRFSKNIEKSAFTFCFISIIASLDGFQKGLKSNTEFHFFKTPLTDTHSTELFADPFLDLPGISASKSSSETCSTFDTAQPRQCSPCEGYLETSPKRRHRPPPNASA